MRNNNEELIKRKSKEDKLPRTKRSHKRREDKKTDRKAFKGGNFSKPA